MAKENMADKVIDLLHKRRDVVRGKLAEQYRGVTPFRMVPATEDEMLEEYENATPEQMNSYIEQYGEFDVGKMIEKMENLKTQRGDFNA